jgi:DNA anti-recombination protein RmuC
MKWLILFVLCALTVARGATAETPEPDGRRDRMRTFLVLRISEALDLPDDKALQISKVLRAAETKRSELVTERRDVERQLRSALEQSGTADSAQLPALIAQANELDGQIAMIPETSFREVQEVLTVDQQARLVLLRPELQAQIKRSVQRRMHERSRR